MRFKLFMLSILSALTLSVSAEPIVGGPSVTIRGTVVDEKGQPLPAASVVVEGTTIGTGTTSDGRFTLQLRHANPVLRVSFMGYQTQRCKIANTRDDIKVRLTPSDNQLNTVVVTGSRVERQLKDVPVITRVISSRDIQRINPVDLAQLLQYELPGLQFGYNSMSQTEEISYQGLGGEYVVFLLDGERISGEGADHNIDFSRFNINDIERIEVVRGAASTLYDSNALGGVVNIITKNANRPVTANVAARYAGSHGQNYSLQAGTRQSRLTTLTSVGYRQRDSYTIEEEQGKKMTTVKPDGSRETEQYAGIPTTIHGYEIWDVSQKIGYSLTDHLKAEVKAGYYHNRKAHRLGETYHRIFQDYTLGGRLNWMMNANHQMNFVYQFDRYDKNQDTIRGGSGNIYSNRMHVGRLSYSGHMGRHRLSAGMEYTHEYLHHYFMPDSGSASRYQAAAFLQEEWQLTDGLTIVAGLRADIEKLYHFHLTPKLTVMYRPWRDFTFRANYAEGYRSPSLKELYQEYDMGGLGMFTLWGNPKLRPEKSRQYSASVEYNHNGLNASVSLYHNRFRDKISYARMDNGTRDMQYVNAEKARTTGVEIMGRYRLAQNFDLTGSYAYVDDYEETDGLNTSYVRPHSMTFGACYRRTLLKVDWTAALNGQWTSRLRTNTLNRDGSYYYVVYDPRTMCNLNLSARFLRGVTAGLMIENLFGYQDKSSDRAVQVPQQGRNYVATLRLDLADVFKW
ncbi:TonB-dependent receptor [Segatella baroniae]|uniref:TonB-dependent receptor n=1 Tax=Segatella baroniae TaxID=305719 RepID=UPI0028E6487E|nr:TonB-dependent receptor [Segatella baroniae]